VILRAPLQGEALILTLALVSVVHLQLSVDQRMCVIKFSNKDMSKTILYKIYSRHFSHNAMEMIWCRPLSRWLRMNGPKLAIFIRVIS